MAGPYLVVRLDAEYSEPMYGVLDLATALPLIRLWTGLAQRIKDEHPDLANLTFSGLIPLYEGIDEDVEKELDEAGGWIVRDRRPGVGSEADEEYDHLRIYPEAEFWFEAVPRHGTEAVESPLMNLRDFEEY